MLCLYQTRIVISFPGCKINIGLNIVSKREDGFHNLQSVFYPVNWTDVIELHPAKETTIINLGNNLEIKNENNIVWKAHQLLQKDFKIPEYEIHLLKNVPSGAGLGGGSADGSAILNLLNKKLALKIPNNVLENYAAILGSDCPFFIRNVPSYVTGRGELMKPSTLSLKGYWLYIVHPKIHIATKLAFSNLKLKESNTELESLTATNIDAWREFVFNDFETSIFQKFPLLENLKNDMYNQGALYASMSGTGSSIYGIFKSEPKKLGLDYSSWIGQLD